MYDDRQSSQQKKPLNILAEPQVGNPTKDDISKI